MSSKPRKHTNQDSFWQNSKILTRQLNNKTLRFNKSYSLKLQKKKHKNVNKNEKVSLQDNPELKTIYKRKQKRKK